MGCAGRLLVGFVVALGVGLCGPRIVDGGVRFEVVIPDTVESYTGRVYVALVSASEAASGRGDAVSPRSRMHSWFNPTPVFAVDVEDAVPGDVVVIGEGSLGHPFGVGGLEAGSWLAQAVLRMNPDSPKAGLGVGDRYSPVVSFDFDGDDGRVVSMVPTESVQERVFLERDDLKLVRFRSELLSEFHGRDVVVRAGVALPEGFADRVDERFPVVIDVPGFGGDHFGVRRTAGMLGRFGLEDVICVVPDPSCYRGHSVFADSATNGPWGAMLVEEMIPRIESRFRGAGAAHRYVTGVSSGGWSSLWLQLMYPDEFAGCWSFVPDPIDFRDFQRIDLYEAGLNMYVDGDGAPRPLARRGDRVLLLYRDFVEREEVLGPGGQIHSFEAVFSRRLEDGTPELLFDRETGAIDVGVAESWRRYDISERLRAGWEELSGQLDGKIRIYAGEVDNFYLEGAVRLLQEWRDEVDASMVVEVVEGLGHSPARRGLEDMASTINRRWSERAGDGGEE